MIRYTSYRTLEYFFYILIDKKILFRIYLKGHWLTLSIFGFLSMQNTLRNCFYQFSPISVYKLQNTDKLIFDIFRNLQWMSVLICLLILKISWETLMNQFELCKFNGELKLYRIIHIYMLLNKSYFISKYQNHPVEYYYHG